jgi:hypothetical protein
VLFDDACRRSEVVQCERVAEVPWPSGSGCCRRPQHGLLRRGRHASADHACRPLRGHRAPARRLPLRPRGYSSFPLGASGDTAPIRRIAGTRTGFSDTDVAFGGVAVNRDGQVFVALNFLGALELWLRFSFSPRMADGDVEPVRRFGAGGFRVDGMALGQDGRVYLACDDDAVRVYAPGAAGPVALPERTISGPRTLLSGPTGIAVDSDGFIYVANRGRATGSSCSPRGPAGDAAPAHQFSGPLTELSSPVGLALRFDLLWVTNSFGVAPRITVYGTRHPPTSHRISRSRAPTRC